MSILTISSTTLCLACSSSLPPSRSSLSLFITTCCNRPICPQCLQSNPRLARHNPCLVCLSGVDAINAASGNFSAKGKQVVNLNVDGAIRDEDNFAIGDDDDEEVEDRTEANSLSVSPPPYSESTPLSTLAEPPTPQRLDTNVNIAGGETNASLENRSQPETQEKSAGSDSSTYYIKSSDNLQGIALRFGLNGRDLCRLNNLPPSTLTTTPHLLHTRPFLILPPSARTHVHSRLEVDQVHEARIAKERAEKRLQILTKEVDWRVAKAYVALADADSASSHLDLKNKEAAEVRRPRVESCEGGCSGTDLETNAVDRYLDDEEWERKTGRGVSVRHFPYASFSN